MISIKSKTPSNGRVCAPVAPATRSKLKDSAAWTWLPAIAMAVTSGVVLTPAPAQAIQTFSANDTDGVVLQDFVSETLFHLDANTTISNAGGAAVAGDSSAAWTFTNNGTITSGNNAAVLFNGSANFVNDADGRLSGTRNGLYSAGVLNLTNSGTIIATTQNGVYARGAGSTITNTGTAALISGFQVGVYLNGGGTLTNEGTITGGSKGAYLRAGGTVTNTGTAARIDGSDIGVVVRNGAGFVNNEGTITATAVTAGNGIYLLTGGTVTNTGTVARISGTDAGVKIAGSAGTVTNEGTIIADGPNSTAIYLAAGGNVTNTGTPSLISGGKMGVRIQGTGGGIVTNEGTISGGRSGIYLYNGGSISNSGTITATGTAGNGIQMFLGGTITNGTIGNSAALISGEVFGVYAKTAAGIVTNFGTISGTGSNGFGVYLKAGGSVTNSGTASRISGTAGGVKIAGTADTVTNDGTIIGTGTVGTGIQMEAGGTITNGGTANSAALVSGITLGVFARNSSASVTNFGTISGTGTISTGIYLQAGGSVANTGTASLVTGVENGVRIAGTAGTMTNDGAITASGTASSGIYLTAGGTVTNGGTANSTARISGAGYGVRVKTAAGIITNFGTISTTGFHGIYMAAGGSITNSGTASRISGVNSGVRISFAAGTVTNDGAITATGTSSNGIDLSFGGTVTNGGTANSAARISGETHGVLTGTSGAGIVSNFGTITGVTGSGVYLTGGGDVANTGTAARITGGDSGVRITATAGTVTNEGTITSSGIYGINLQAGGAVTNAGTGAYIFGTKNGVYIGGPSGTLRNEGTIKSTGTIGAGNAAVLLKAGTVTNSGAASLISGSKNGIYISAAAGTITNEGTITGSAGNGVSLYAGGSITNRGSISGSTGILLKAGGSISNSRTITGVNTGIFMVAGGDVSNSGTITGGSFGINLQNGGSVGNSGTITSGNTGVYMSAGSTLTNTGLIDADGLGVFVAGGTVINSGTIKDVTGAGILLLNGAAVTNNSSGSLIGANGAEIGSTSTLTNFGTITGTGNGAVRFSGSGGVLILGTGSKINGDINGGSGGTGKAVNLTGSGTLANALTNFAAGSTLTVASGANWTASGSWAMPTVTNSGTLQPGVAGTPLNVTGNFTQTSTGVLKSVLTSTGSASLLNITGTAALAGSVAITPPASITAGTQKYTFLTASAGVSGTFSSVSGGTALLTPALSYDANNAFVTLTQQAVAQPTTPATPTTPTTPTTTTGSSQSENENAFAKAFDAAYAANPALFAPILASLNQIKTRDDLNNALNQLTGENAAAVTNMIQSQVSEFLSQFQQHSQSTMGVTEVDDPWITGFIQSGNFKGNGNANEIRETAWGFTAGADHVVSTGFRLGVMGGMGQQRSNTGGGAGSAKVWYEQIAATADYSDGNWYLNGMVGMSLNHGTTMRTIRLPGISATALGHLTSTQVLASGQAGYGVPLDTLFTLVPFAGVDISSTNQDAYAETGAGALNLSFTGRTINNQRSILGARLKGANVDVLGLPLNTELKMGWAHQFAAVNPAAVAAFASLAGPSFTVTGVPLARDAGVIGLGVATAVASNASIHLRYDGEFSGISSSNTLSFGLAVDW